MAAAKGIPPSLTTKWNINARPSNSASAGVNRKLNTSCNSCRKSRVKCSGGHPCQRCAGSSNPYNCAYSISQRRGKHRADEISSTSDETTSSPESGVMTPFGGLNPNDWVEGHDDPIWNNLAIPTIETEQNSLDPSLLPANLDYEMRNSPSLTDFLDSLQPPTPPPASNRVGDRGKCAESCFVAVHQMTTELISVNEESSQNSMENALRILDQSIGCAVKYLACPNCDPGCPRIMNLSFLHQRQVNALSKIAKQPALFLNNASQRFALGDYRASKEEDVMMKRMVLLRVVGDVLKSVNECHERSKQFEDQAKAGTLYLGEIGETNLRWLFDIAANLTRRLGCVKSILEEENWALNVVS